MSIVSTKNSMSVLIAANPTQIALGSVQITDPTTTNTFIADGQILMLDESDAVMTPANSNISDSPSVRFVVRNGATASTASLNFSARIRGKDLVACTGKNYSAITQQVSYVGYNGTSGTSLDASGTDFTLTLVGDWDDQFWSEQKNRTAFNYYSTAATQQAIATSFTNQINAQGFRATAAGTGPIVKAETLNDATTAVTSTATTLIVVNGSDIGTLNVADTTFQTIGAVVRLGSVAATTTSPVYVVTATPSTDSSLTSTQIRFHTYFQGTTGTVTLGTLSNFVSGATNWGIKLTGLALTWVKDFFKAKVVSFHTDLKGFGTTTSGTSTVPSLGTGDYKLVSEFESFAAGNEGALNRTVVPLPTGRNATVSTANYDTIAIESQDSSITNTVAANARMRVQTMIFIPTSSTQIVPLLSQLNPYIASAGLPAITIA